MMAGKQAKILSTANIDDLLLFAETTRQPFRNKVIVLLSAKAGLRAGEIAHLASRIIAGALHQQIGIRRIERRIREEDELSVRREIDEG